MPTMTSHCRARRRAPVFLSLLAAGLTVVALAHADEGDIIVQRDVTPRIAYRGIPTESLPVRTAVSPFPTRAFNQSIGSVMSALSDGELSTSHVSINSALSGLQRPVAASLNGLQPGPGSLMTGTATGGAAVGGVGGQVVQATAGIASQISGALMPLSRGGQP